MVIEITRDDIADTTCLCPIAARLRRQLDVPFTVDTDKLILRPKDREPVGILWPKIAAEFIRRSDNSEEIWPIRFTMPI